VRLARESERSISDVARDLGVHPESLRVWVRQDEADDGSRSDRLTTAEREELTALRREVRDLSSRPPRVQWCWERCTEP